MEHLECASRMAPGTISETLSSEPHLPLRVAGLVAPNRVALKLLQQASCVLKTRVLQPAWAPAGLDHASDR